MSDSQKIMPEYPAGNNMQPTTHSNGPNFPGEQKQSPGMKMSHPLGCQCKECCVKTWGGKY